MKIYITGVAGFLGSHLADWLTATGHDVWGCDDLSTGDEENVPGHIMYFRKSMEHIRAEELRGVDVLYHCAAAAYEGTSVFSPAYVCQNIFADSARLFSTAIQAGVPRIVFCSSMARYGKQGVPFEEDSTVARPVDPYGIAKLATERLLESLATAHRFFYSIAVPHNIYGPRQRYIDPYRNVAAIMTNRMLQGKPPIIYGDGLQVRCFSYIDDVVAPLAAMGMNPEARGQVINIGPDTGEVTVLELARKLARLTNCGDEPIHMPARPLEVKHAYCSSAKARQILGLGRQTTDLDTGLAHLVDYVRHRGPRPFQYHLPIEIRTHETPATWTERLM